MNSSPENFLRIVRMAVVACAITLILLTGVVAFLFHPEVFNHSETTTEADTPVQKLWQPPDISTLSNDEAGKQILFGRKLIANTARYLGPKGSLQQISNGMNCQNCHLDAGTRPFGNNYASVASLYPKFRARSGTLESIEKRINDCLERSLNGSPLDSLSQEMKAIVAYIKWVGKDVVKGETAKGSGLYELPYLNRAADTVKGKSLFQANCARCHAEKGEGIKRFDNVDYVYPPLWGDNSFNTGAGLYRLSNFARYIFTNMPQGATYKNPILTQEQAWDIAAYVVSLPRPIKTFREDWPKIESKPVDHPFGPYADKFTEAQHKFGPFPPIVESLK